MSYLFDEANEALRGSLKTPRGNTDMFCSMWVKATDWDGGSQGYIQLSEDVDDSGPGIGLTNSSTIDAVQAWSRQPDFTGDWATETVPTDGANGVWWLIMGHWPADQLQRTVWDTDSEGFGTSVATIDPNTALDEIMIGNQDSGASGWSIANPCKIAEVCFWDRKLTNPEMDMLRTTVGTGRTPNTIASRNVFGYWTLRNDPKGLLNQGYDVGGTLSIEGTTPDADHPIILPGAPIRKLAPILVSSIIGGSGTVSITLVDDVGTQLSDLTNLTWAWFDQDTINTVSTPIDQGTGEITDSSGVLEIEITGTTLVEGQTGILTLMDSSGYIYALYRVTL